MINNRNCKSAYYAIIAILAVTISSHAVNSITTRQKTAADFLKGETENTVIDSAGTIKLARQSETVDLKDLLDDSWVINTIVTAKDGTIYLGTSPNGNIIKIKKGEAKNIYPEQPKEPAASVADPNDPNSVAEDTFRNEHIFAMALDYKKRLLVGVSGSECKLLRLERGKFKTVFEPEEANYILDITLDKAGNIYVATGPNGRIYRLSPSGQKPNIVYDAQDNNILALAIDKNGFIYAGSDERGLIYKIHPFDQSAAVLYDSEQNEITDLIFDDQGNLYATATSAESVSSQTRAAGVATPSKPGRPDTESGSEETAQTELKPANTDKTSKDSGLDQIQQPQRGASAKSAGHIYKITPEGFVTDIFDDMAVFFTIVWEKNDLILGTGNNAQLFAIDPKTEKKTLAFEDDEAAQITALAKAGESLYVGTANPAKLIILAKTLAEEGIFTSSLVDATQPARWGKFQIEADIPESCRILLAARSGNVDDPNDPTFSEWTKDKPVTEATQLECPVGRFCQYRLTMTTTDPAKTPVVRQVAIPHVVPNLAPIVASLKAERSKDLKKPSVFNITAVASDSNKDTLTYEIEFRKLGRSGWIKLKDKLEKSRFEWDTNTVEDARYEVRVIADDEKSNTPQTALTGSRISDAFVIDNTAPKIAKENIKIVKDVVRFTLTIQDAFTAIGNLSYTVDSNEDWISMLPDDLVYDTTTEDFTIQIEGLEAGEHVVAIKISDDIKNVAYKTFDINIK